MYEFSADGGYAEYIKVDAKRIVPLPSKVPYEFGASLGCAGITAIHAVNSIGKVSLGDRVAVRYRRSRNVCITACKVKWCRNGNSHRQDRRQTTDGTGELWSR
jgi:D-arabinose 1-dehydrogenase-like Zn-dependent alcohol dehydrogenase